MTRLNDLYNVGGQSPWIDDLKRSYLTTDGLQKLVDAGVRGMTSNPTIMTNAIAAGTDYDEQFASVVEGGMSVADAYWELVLQDVNDALKIFRPVYDASEGEDGFVSVEVAPGLAHDTKGTIEAALSLHERMAQPNMYVKIPATMECLPAIEEVIAAGHSVNVTLIFSLERYDAVIEAYLTGLERFKAAGGDLHPVSSVASFFVSRVDTEIDKRLDAIIESATDDKLAARAKELKGKGAVAQARLAYALFEERFGSERGKALLDAGARYQRPLWASTSTKNPDYPDLLYVDSLIGPNTVNTMPPATVDAFQDHGVVSRTIDIDVDEAREVLSSLKEVGVDLDDVTAQLEREGVASFTKSFDELDEKLNQKAAALGISK